MNMRSDVLKGLRMRLLAGTCAAICTVPALAASLERIDRESYVAVGKQALAADPAAGAAALAPVMSAEPRFRNLAQALPNGMRGKVLTAEGLARTHLGQLDAGRAKRASQDLLQLRDVSPLGNGAQIVRFGTQVQGVEVFRRSVSVLVDGEQTLRAVSGIWPPVQEEAVGKTALAWPLHAEDALAAALAGYGFEAAAARAAVRPMRSEAGYLPMALEDTVAGANDEHLQSSRAKKVLFPLAGKLLPAWYVETVVALDGTPEAEYYAHVVDAASGEILFRHLQTEDANFKWNVWADASPPHLPYPNPHGRNYVPYPGTTSNGTIPPTVPANVVNLQNVPFSQNDPWLPATATVTTGNNAEAYIDLNNDGYEPGFDFRSPVFPDGGPDPDPYNTSQDPAITLAQREAAVRQMFYMVNWTHDWYYDAGFDESAGNAQADNFGRGGAGGDSIRAEGQDNTNSGTINCAPNCANNANMSTPADGGRPRMQMYTFSPTGASSFSLISPIAATYGVGLPGWSTLPFNVTAEVVQALDAGGTPTGSTTTDGCTAYTNAAAVSGKIAFVDRGTCDFVVKTQAAINAGAVGVLIGNVAASASPGTPPGMACNTGSCPAATFPALGLRLDDANVVRGELADGTVTGRMLREAGVRPDGTVDNQIMAHELGHYISNRLVENSSGLTTNMSRGMGEGWGDFHSLLFTTKPEDINLPWNANWTGAYALAMYPTGNFFYGLRRYPYSANPAVNPLTLRHIQTGVALPTSPPPLFTGDNAAVHNTGEVWASSLWACYVNLLRAHPFPEAQDRMKVYLIAGYKMTPAAPLITEARDAVLAAAHASDPADFQRCSTGFASRGLGISAATPDRFGTTNAGTVEDFSATGGRVAFGSISADDGGTCDNDGVIDNGESGIVTIRWNNTGWSTLSGSSLQVFSDYPGLTFSGSASSIVPVAATAPFGVVDVQVPVELVGAPADGIITFTVTASDPALIAPASTQLDLRVDYDEPLNSSATETFDTNVFVWNLRLTDGAVSLKDWGVTEAAGQTVAHGPAVGAAGVAWIESPDIAVGSGAFSVALNHRYSFESDGTHYDGGVVEVSTDAGATWTAVSGSPSIYGGVLSNCCSNPLQGRQALVANSAGYPAYTNTTINLGTAYSGQTVRLRFGVAEDEAVGTAGWDINTVTVTGASNLPFPRRTWQAQVCPNATVADITVAPASLAATAAPGATATANLSIGNAGAASLHWAIAEAGSAPPACDLPGDIAWLSVGTPAGTTAAAGNTNVVVTFNAAGLGAGNHSANLCIDNNDATNPRVTVPVTFSVSNVAPAFSSTPVTTAVQDAAYSYSVTATDANAGETLTITAPTLPTWLVLSDAGNGTATLAGTPDDTDVGSHAVVLRVTDAGGLFAEQSFSITVGANNTAPVAVGTIAAQVDDEGDSVTLDVSTAFADADAGDVLTYSATGLPPGLSIDAATGIISGDIDYDSAGSYSVTVTATDAADASATQAFTWTVNDVVRPLQVFADGFESD